jgi:hypothetical protein
MREMTADEARAAAKMFRLVAEYARRLSARWFKTASSDADELLRLPWNIQCAEKAFAEMLATEPSNGTRLDEQIEWFSDQLARLPDSHVTQHEIGGSEWQAS